MKKIFFLCFFVLFVLPKPVFADDANSEDCKIFQSKFSCKGHQVSSRYQMRTFLIYQRSECFCVKCLEYGRINGQIIGRVGSRTYGNDLFAKIRINTPDDISWELYQQAIVENQSLPVYVYSTMLDGYKPLASFRAELSNLQANTLLDPTPKYGFQISRAAQNSFEGKMLEKLTPGSYRVARVTFDNERAPQVLFKKSPCMETAKNCALSNKLSPKYTRRIRLGGGAGANAIAIIPNTLDYIDEGNLGSKDAANTKDICEFLGGLPVLPDKITGTTIISTINAPQEFYIDEIGKIIQAPFKGIDIIANKIKRPVWSGDLSKYEYEDSPMLMKVTTGLTTKYKSCTEELRPLCAIVP